MDTFADELFPEPESGMVELVFRLGPKGRFLFNIARKHLSHQVGRPLTEAEAVEMLVRHQAGQLVLQ